ncbi:MAG: T9SS type A sorting domain-containing protein [candidate division Zixibacteria bacterium]|nr:T9SS type A sorting domain-containing protein [candidate division Zixibacteria bacterium]
MKKYMIIGGLVIVLLSSTLAFSNPIPIKEIDFENFDDGDYTTGTTVWTHTSNDTFPQNDWTVLTDPWTGPTGDVDNNGNGYFAAANGFAGGDSSNVDEYLTTTFQFDHPNPYPYFDDFHLETWLDFDPGSGGLFEILIDGYQVYSTTSAFTGRLGWSDIDLSYFINSLEHILQFHYTGGPDSYCVFDDVVFWMEYDWDLELLGSMHTVYRNHTLIDTFGITAAVRNNFEEVHDYVVFDSRIYCDSDTQYCHGDGFWVDPLNIGVMTAGGIDYCNPGETITIASNISGYGDWFRDTIEVISPREYIDVYRYDDPSTIGDAWGFTDYNSCVAVEYVFDYDGFIYGARLGLSSQEDYESGPMYVIVYSDEDEDGFPDSILSENAHYFDDIPLWQGPVPESGALYEVPLDVPVTAGKSYWIALRQKEIYPIGYQRTLVGLDETTDDMRSKWEYYDGQWSQNNRFDGDTFIRALIGPSSTGVDVLMVPHNPPIVVPAGGSFWFNGYLKNDTDRMQMTDVWIKLVLPNMSSYGPIEVFRSIPLDPYDTLSYYYVRQDIPGNAMLGTYNYVAYCGVYPTTSINVSSFPFTVIAPLSGGASEWNLSGWFDDNGEQPELPRVTSLQQNYPNPFNSATNIPVDLDKSEHVSLKIYNISGQLVESIVDRKMDAGQHLIKWDAYNYASGIYFYKLQIEDYNQIKKMHLLK